MRRVLLAVAACAIGCGGGGGGKGADGGGGGDLSSNGAQVPVTGVLTSSGNGGGSTPISGATVAIAGTSTSTTSAADGSFTLMAAAGSTIFVTASLSGYVSSEWGFVVTGSGGEIANTELLSSAEVMSVTSGLSPALTIDKTKGVVVVQFHDGGSTGTAGYSASLSASHGNPFSPDSSTYTSTTPGGGSDTDNPIVFPNVVTGTTTVMVTPASGKTCTPEGTILDWRVDPATFTWVRYNCQ